MTITAAPPVRIVRATPRWVVVSAWTVPFLVVGQFAMVAVLPVVLVLVGSLRDSRLRALRPWAVALAAAYATPLVLWIVGPDRARACRRTCTRSSPAWSSRSRPR